MADFGGEEGEEMECGGGGIRISLSLDERLVDPTNITDAILGCGIKFEESFGKVEERLRRCCLEV